MALDGWHGMGTGRDGQIGLQRNRGSMRGKEGVGGWMDGVGIGGDGMAHNCGLM